MSAIDEILRKAKPATAGVRICLDGSLLGEIDLLEDRLSELAGWEPVSLSDPDPRTELRAKLQELKDQARADQNQQEFRFQALGDKAWSDLLAAHPAREDNEEDAGRWDSTTFPAALVAAASVDPVMQVEDVERLWAVLNGHSRNLLFTTAYSANVRSVDVPFSPGSSGAADATARS